MSKYDDLVKKLKEIFQIDRPELDFGIYKVLGVKSKEINAYLEVGLKKKISDILAEKGEIDTLAKRNSLEAQIREEFGKRAFNESGELVDEAARNSALGIKFKSLTSQESRVADGENTIFSNLLTFFSRYYLNGDIISQRRYKGDVYSIPYSGEEVVLYWANKDQYYTKSGENFSNYGFKLSDGRAVRFSLVAADISKDNRKDSDKERFFSLVGSGFRVFLDEDGNQYEDELIPVEVVKTPLGEELIIRFEYKAYEKGTKQETLLADAEKNILSLDFVRENWSELSALQPSDKNSKRTLLEKCLVNYAAKNTADYFVHKNLKKFLTNELDFYIKNELMHLDDIQNIEIFGDLENSLSLIKAFRLIALDLINFLSQIEDFQKKLWLKKKFVVSTNYCVTLDRIPKSLYQQIASNERQWDQWKLLGVLSGGDGGIFEQAVSKDASYLESNQYLMVDTSLFDNKFKADLLSNVDHLDEWLNGLMIHGDNFQAINLLQQKYAEKIQCIYIDPPYNTSASEIIYKNNYKHSSWMSFIYDRLLRSRNLLRPDGIFEMAIDDAEGSQSKLMMEEVFGQDNFISTIAVQHNPRGRADALHISPAHEYLHMYAKNYELLRTNQLIQTEEELSDKYSKSDAESPYRELPFKRSGSNSRRIDRPNLFYPLYYSEREGKLSLSKVSDDYVEILPLDANGEEKVWRWGATKAESLFDTEFIVKKNPKGGFTVNLKDRIKNTIKPKSFWYGPKHDASSYGTMLLKNLFGSTEFSYPKSKNTVEDALLIGSTPDSTIFDFFAGSGTTGQAVIDINRGEKSHRKYILVEQGEYFDSVTKPRIQKSVFSSTWKDGVPLNRSSGISHAFKVIKLESYEDALNNLELKVSSDQKDMLESLPDHLREQYLISYSLEIESRGSILSVDDFNNPFEVKMKIASDSAGAYQLQKIDLVETFNYLIGLKVEHIDIKLDFGFVLVSGFMPTGEKTLVIWRDVNALNYEKLNTLCQKMAINPADSEFEIIYINGDHNVPAVFSKTEEEGGITSKALKIRQIEPEFLSRMFSPGEA